MKECILELSNASFSYDGEHQALDNINVKIYKGERIAVLGDNGAGKSTFFLCLNGVLSLSKGDLFINNNKIKYKKKDLGMLRESVGFVFQDPDSQMIASTVESEISFGPMNRKIPLEKVKRKVNQIMRELNLDHLRKIPPHYLSGGEKKRVSIADILVMDPNVLLLDEPTASLDGKNVEIFEEILSEQSLKGITILSSTHDINFAWKWANRVLVFHKGKIIADDVPEQIFTNNSLLTNASLKKPALYQFTEMICENFNISLPSNLPKDEKQLAEFLSQVK